MSIPSVWFLSDGDESGGEHVEVLGNLNALPLKLSWDRPRSFLLLKACVLKEG